MDIVVEKCFPLAYVDGYDAKPGETGPRPVQVSRSEADEMKEVEKWEVSLVSISRVEEAREKRGGRERERRVD